jgi:hypothetical protein
VDVAHKDAVKIDGYDYPWGLHSKWGRHPVLGGGGRNPPSRYIVSLLGRGARVTVSLGPPLWGGLGEVRGFFHSGWVVGVPFGFLDYYRGDGVPQVVFLTRDGLGGVLWFFVYVTGVTGSPRFVSFVLGWWGMHLPPLK